MAQLSTDAVKKLIHAIGDKAVGNAVATAINNGDANAAADLVAIAAMIVATSTSTTTDFAALAVGDKVLSIPAVAGNSIFYTVATAGTLPAAAVIGTLYVVLRAAALPTASAINL
jgi:hypothetical protein